MAEFSNATIEELRKKAVEFSDKRDWKQFHNPKDTALALSIEVAEVLEHFRFKTNDEIKEYLKNPENKKEIGYELADVLHFILILAEETGIDITKAFYEKFDELEKKYPVEKRKGKPHKYTYYEKKY